MQYSAWILKTILLTSLLYFTSINAQTIELVSDINTSSEIVGGEPSDLVKYNGKVYYSADFYPYGRELYVFDNDTGIASLVADVKAGGGSSSPSSLTVLNNKLYFFADDGIHGEELFVLDSETNKVVLAADIRRGSESSIYHYGKWLTIYNEQLYFFADNGVYGRELYVYDDSAQTASLVADINEGELSGIRNSQTKNIIVFDDKLYFGADNGTNGNELYYFDSTTKKTVRVASASDSDYGSSPDSFTVYEDKLYYSAGKGGNSADSLYQYDSQTSKAVEIFDGINAFYASTRIFDLVFVDNILLFKAFKAGDQLYAEEKIFSYNIIQDKVEQIDQDIDDLCTPLDRLFSSAIRFNGEVYFRESDGGCVKLFRFDKKINRIVEVSESENFVLPDSASTVEVANNIFYANNGYLARYNKATTNTDTIHFDTNANSSSPNQLAVYKNKLYFSATTTTKFLYQYDPMTRQNEKVYNSAANAYYTSPKFITVFDDKLFHYSSQRVDDSDTDTELNALNEETNSFNTIFNDAKVNSVGGSEQQLFFSSKCILYSYLEETLTQLVDLSDQTNCSIYDITFIDSAVYFRNKNQNLYHYDLVSNELVHFFTGGFDTGYVNFNIVKYQGELYFPGNNFDGSGIELYRYNVENKLVELVADIRDDGSSSPTNLMVYNNKLFFSAHDASARRFSYDRKLYVFDAESDDVTPVFEQSITTNYVSFQLYQNKLYFVARSKDEGSDRAYELYAYNDISDELTLIEDIYHTRQADKVGNFAVLKNKLYFNADFGTHGSELYSLHINSAPEGSVDIQVTDTVPLTLKAVNNFEDADGLGEINYQWLRDEEFIEGAVNYSYVLTEIDVGNNISVIASFTDGNGTDEQIVSVVPYLDSDGDGITDHVDTDDDNDGVEDSQDAFPLDSSESVDTDNDGIGNNSDTDDDNDGVEDSQDAFPLDSSKSVLPDIQKESRSGGGSTSFFLLLLLCIGLIIRNSKIVNK